MGLLNSENDKVSGEEWVLNKMKNSSGGVIFDIGANIGEYSKLLRNNFPDSRIIAFEPHPKTFERLRKNTEADKITTVNAGVGKENGNLKLYDYSNQEGSEHASFNKNVFDQMYNADIEEFDVSVVTIDNYCMEHQIDKIHFLKIDVEGLEFDVIQGAREMLDAGRINYIQFEFNINNAYTKVGMNDFIQYLEGYTLYRLLSDGWINITEEKNLIQEIYAFQNIVAVKKQK